MVSIGLQKNLGDVAAEGSGFEAATGRRNGIRLEKSRARKKPAAGAGLEEGDAGGGRQTSGKPT